ncbi:ABC transporter substrate-binding protein [Cellulomonas sp. IC4_254]|uniref:ABC transporter substrate-binding protein n=1 Tax=Cellulomonas sp. IC4_254 TaxID=2714040 RepID=UPI0014230BE2|nr:ABC transporter substrate-binding protein [Cellulomonas sp. IC4_254]NHT17437.1 ABC transporter substrate-binding protein [Cellulomonas sp. IC4_254]
MTARVGGATRAGVVLAALAALAVLAGCTAPEPPAPVPGLRPELSLSGEITETVRLGVLVPPVDGAGSEFRPQVEGARVAAYRFGLGGHRVELRVALDDGTADGALRAMRQLLEDRVAGIVLASPGAHTADAVAAADESATAVVLPYSSAAAHRSGSWSVAPSSDAVAARVQDALDGLAATRPYRVVAADRLDARPDAAPEGSPATGALDDPDATAEEVVALLERREVDSVVVDGAAIDQAALVIALQEMLGTRQLPVVLTPEALTPGFGDVLAAAGTSGGRLLGVGTDAQDHRALTDPAGGSRTATFLAAVRLASGDPACRNVYDDDTCAAGVPLADAASHDATLALVRAVDAAASVEPARVRDALGGLRLGRADGLAGPGLDFSTPQALADDDVVVLHASTSDAGVRPAAADGRRASLSWFAGSGP